MALTFSQAISAATAGKIRVHSAQRGGQLVRAGQVLVSLDSGLERAALDIARHRATMEGAVKTGESRLAFASQKFQRRDELLSQKYVSQQDHDESRTEMRLAQSELQDARDNRRLAELEARG